MIYLIAVRWVLLIVLAALFIRGRPWRNDVLIPARIWALLTIYWGSGIVRYWHDGSWSLLISCVLTAVCATFLCEALDRRRSLADPETHKAATDAVFHQWMRGEITDREFIDWHNNNPPPRRHRDSQRR